MSQPKKGKLKESDLLPYGFLLLMVINFLYKKKKPISYQGKVYGKSIIRVDYLRKINKHVY